MCVGTLSLEDEGTINLQNVRNHSCSNTASQTSRAEWTAVLLWKPVHIVWFIILFCCQACRGHEEDHTDCYRGRRRTWSSHVLDNLSEICTSRNPNNRIRLYSELYNVIENWKICSPVIITVLDAWCIYKWLQTKYKTNMHKHSMSS